MSTNRQNIMNAFKSIIDGITDPVTSEAVVKYSKINKVTPVDLEVTPFPACFIYMPEQVREMSSAQDAVIGNNLVTWRNNAIIEMWVDGTAEHDAETSLGYLQKTFERSFRLNDTVCYARLMKIETFTIDMDKEITGVFLSFDLVFRHDRYVP